MSELGAQRLVPQLLPGGLDEPPAAAEGNPGLFEFLAPGLLHELGNAVFKIQGHAQAAALPGTGAGRALGEVQKHAQQAKALLELVRCLVQDGAGVAMQCGVLLPQVCELLEVPLRGHGLRVRFQHSSRQSPGSAPVATTARAVLGLARELARAVPIGFRGVLVVDLQQQTPVIVLRLAVTGDPALLPFPIDLRGALARANAWLAALPVGAGPTADGRALELRIATGDAHRTT
jgi:hypothetical protein